MIEVSYGYVYFFKSFAMFFAMLTIYSIFYLTKKNVLNCFGLAILFSLLGYVIFESKSVTEKNSIYLITDKKNGIEYQSYEDKRLKSYKPTAYKEKPQPIVISPN